MAEKELALVALMKAVDKIPDKAWAILPGMKEKEKTKAELQSKEREIEDRHHRRRDSESSKYRSSREYDRADRAVPRDDGDRKARRNRAMTTDSPEGDSRERGRRSGEQSRRSSQAGPPPVGYPGVPYAQPIAYPQHIPYGQQIAYAVPGAPPMNPQLPFTAGYIQGYAVPHSGSNSPVWSNNSSRRSSMQSHNYSPANNGSPQMYPYAQPPQQAFPVFQAHPAYTNGAAPSSAANRYTPAPPSKSSPQEQSPLVQSPVQQPAEPANTYAPPFHSRCNQCGQNTFSPQLPLPQPQNALSFPFMISSHTARSPYSYSQKQMQLAGGGVDGANGSAGPTPLNLSNPTSRRGSLTGGQQATFATGEHCAPAAAAVRAPVAAPSGYVPAPGGGPTDPNPSGHRVIPRSTLPANPPRRRRRSSPPKGIKDKIDAVKSDVKDHALPTAMGAVAGGVLAAPFGLPGVGAVIGTVGANALEGQKKH